ncbi:hypothetical protein AB0I28_12625 [Phytomonospora sp. NPDC050363]|uniref:hypothetical protein n=1 Tax=Phytomonospora sp. NPDC050363 TaxID=3155642 RepID=UPI0033E26A6F
MDTPDRIARRPLVITAAITAGLLLIGLQIWALWPSALDRLKDRDESGGVACELLVQWLDGDLYEAAPDDPKARTDAFAKLTAGQLVSEATTPAIHATWTGGGDVDALPGVVDPIPIHGVNLPGLYKACEAEGIDMPPKTDVF